MKSTCMQAEQEREACHIGGSGGPQENYFRPEIVSGAILR